MGGLRHFTLIINEPQSSLRERAKKNINAPHQLRSFQPFALFWGTVSFASTVRAFCVLSFNDDGKVGSFTTRFSSEARLPAQAVAIGKCLTFPSPNSMKRRQRQ
jgi:hypothetical protein